MTSPTEVQTNANRLPVLAGDGAGVPALPTMEAGAIRRLDLPSEEEFNRLVFLAGSFHKSGFFSVHKTAEQILTVMLYGRELGIPCVESLMSFSVIQGRVSPKAEWMRGRFLEAGGKIEWTEVTASRVAARFTWNGKTTEFSFADDDVKRAQLERGADSNHLKYPREMKIARVSAIGVRTVAPHVLRGCSHSVEEMASEGGIEIDARENVVGEDASAPAETAKEAAKKKGPDLSKLDPGLIAKAVQAGNDLADAQLSAEGLLETLHPTALADERLRRRRAFAEATIGEPFPKTNEDLEKLTTKAHAESIRLRNPAPKKPETQGTLGA